MSVRDDGMPVRMLTPSVYQEMNPTITVATARVVISEFRPSLAMSSPLSNPMVAPSAGPARTATQSGAENRDRTDAVTIDVSPSVDPTERSNWPPTRGMIADRLRIARTAWLPTMLRKFRTVANESGSLRLKPTTTAAKSSKRK